MGQVHTLRGSLTTSQKDSLYNDYVVNHTPYYHEEAAARSNGMSGEPLSYSIATDSFVALGLLLFFAISVVSLSKSWRFISFQTKNLFRMPRANSFEMRETLNEIQYMLFFRLQGIVLYSLLAYEVSRNYIATEYRISHYLLMAAFFCLIAIYFLLRGLLNRIVLPVFFEKEQRHLANISRTFLIAMQGVLLLPIVLIHIYSGISIQNTLYAVAVVFSITILLCFHKAYRMFFDKKGGFLQFFLYLCTLEAVPLALLAGSLLFVANFFKVNI